MNPTRKTINTRVCIDDTFGPFDCTLDPAIRWNGFLSPSFTLPVARELSAQTLRAADEYGYEAVETVHVVDGRADSANTVHLIESGLTRTVNEWGDRVPVTVAVRIPWRGLDRGKSVKISDATPAARKAARKSKATGRGPSRAVVVHVRWHWMLEDGQPSAEVIQPDGDGLYAIGGFEWAWSFASWWCACGACLDWHDLDCLCGLTRDDQPRTPLGVAGAKVGQILRIQAPEATSALVDFTGLARVCAVFAENREIDTADDTGPFDTETLGCADEVLRIAMDEAAVPQDINASGWEHVPDEKSTALYRITFPAPTNP